MALDLQIAFKKFWANLIGAFPRNPAGFGRSSEVLHNIDEMSKVFYRISCRIIFVQFLMGFAMWPRHTYACTEFRLVDKAN